MVSFVTGFSGSGKSRYIKEEIKRLVFNTDGGITLIVPEQFSFESERELYSLLGAGKASERAEVLSFTRLADKVFKTYGGIAGKAASKTDKLVFMNRAAAELKDVFEYYSKASGYKSFTADMLGAAEEIKNSGADAEAILAAARLTKDGVLQQKAEEICMLFDTYNAILHKSRVDDSDCLKRAAKRLEGTDFFKGRTVFFDEFKSFTGAQLELIKLIIAQSDGCVFSLCTDRNGERNEIFSVVNDTVNRIKRIARTLGVKISAPKELCEPRRFNSPELAFAEKNLLSYSAEKYGGRCENIRFAAAANIFEETRYAAATLSSLVRENGYRYRDFAIILSEPDVYMPAVKSTLEHYEIVGYFDSLQGIKDSPVIKFVTELLRLSSGGFNIDSVFSLLRCGFSEFSPEEIDEFESYCFVWDIRGRDFKSEFKANPNGYGEKFTEDDVKKLELFNEIRSYIIKICGKIKAGDSSTAESIGRAVFGVLQEYEINVKTERAVQDASLSPEDANRYARAWEALLEILDSLAAASEKKAYTLAEYLDLFDFACGEYDMGTVPQLADAVTIGAPGRIRLGGVKVVFVLGAQKDSFPKLPAESGVFSEAEQKKLGQSGLSFAKPFSYRLDEQRFNAYKILTTASDRLYVCASYSGLDGGEQYLSEIFRKGAELFGDDVIINVSELDDDYFCANGKTTFLTLAKNFRSNTPKTAAMRAYLEKDPAYGGRLRLLESAQNQSGARLLNRGGKDCLFSGDIKASPSSFERFYQCKFKYFCCDGLYIRPRQKARLDPLSRGTLIHDLLEHLLKDPGFYAYSAKELEKAAGERLTEYLETVMSGAENKTEQFKYLYGRLKTIAGAAAEHLQSELLQSAFKPADFELKTGTGEAGGLQFVLGDGGKITINGKIDRVDTALINGVNYARVIDYKSGGKDFDLSDILDGQNMQMLIYLFCICKKGSGKYKNAQPAGILYMPAAALKNSAGRADENIDRIKNSQYRMKGLVLNDAEVLNAMERGAAGVFIPAKLNKDGGFSANSSVASNLQFELLYKHIESCAEKMANSLKDGDISAVPLNFGDRSACDFCDYASVCGVEDGDNVREKTESDKDEVFKLIEKELNADER